MTGGNADGPLTYLGPTAPATEAKHFAGEWVCSNALDSKQEWRGIGIAQG